MNEQAYYANSPWGWRERLRFKLFPSLPCPLPEAPAYYEGVLEIRTIAVLDWKDRLRVLLTGKLMVETRTVTEHTSGGVISSSVVYPLLRLPK